MNVGTIYKAFEDAFTGYFVEVPKRPELHIERWLSAGVDFSLSYGVKVDGKLVAFILHSPREDFVMNLATGVMRAHQGQGLTRLMYQRIKHDLPLKDFRRTQLEVITENARALRAYEKEGFEKKRLLLSWKGEFSGLRDAPGSHLVKKASFSEEHAELNPFPLAFEQETFVVMKRTSQLELHELRAEGKLLAYAVWNPWQMNLVQLAGTDPESVTGLLFRMKLSGEHAGMINVDEKNELINGVLRDNGLKNYLSQYEMVLSFLGPLKMAST